MGTGSVSARGWGVREETVVISIESECRSEGMS